MTVLVAAKIKDQMVIGSDSLISTSDNNVKDDFCKIYKINDFLLAGAGTTTVFHILEDFCKDKKKKAPNTAQECYKLVKPIFVEYKRIMEDECPTYSKSSDEGIQVMVVTRDKIFAVDEYSAEDYTSRGYAVCGCGDLIALGAMYATYPNKSCVRLAIEAAIYYHPNCGGKPNIIEVD